MDWKWQNNFTWWGREQRMMYAYIEIDYLKDGGSTRRINWKKWVDNRIKYRGNEQRKREMGGGKEGRGRENKLKRYEERERVGRRQGKREQKQFSTENELKRNKERSGERKREDKEKRSRNKCFWYALFFFLISFLFRFHVGLWRCSEINSGMQTHGSHVHHSLPSSWYRGIPQERGHTLVGTTNPSPTMGTLRTIDASWTDHVKEK